LTQSPIHFAVTGGLALLMALLLARVPLSQVALVFLLPAPFDQSGCGTEPT